MKQMMRWVMVSVVVVLAALRPAAATTRELCSTLGDDQPPSLLDQDIFRFTGTTGETVTVTLAADPDGAQTGERATLLLTDEIASVFFARIDSSALPNTVQATLPATGAYLVTVAEHPDFLPGHPFLGANCVTLESSAQAGETFTHTATVESLAPLVKRVFVTSTAYTGNLGGLAGADATCQDRATAAGLGGTFMAWLSAAGSGNSAAERFLTQASVPYVRVDGVQVAANFSDLVDGTLAQPIPVDENGATATGQEFVWTGTTPSGGFSGFDCQGWDTGGAGTLGTAGRRIFTSPLWTTADHFVCSQVFRLYCIEQ